MKALAGWLCLCVAGNLRRYLGHATRQRPCFGTQGYLAVERFPLCFFFLPYYYLTSSFMDNVPAGWDQQQQLRRQVKQGSRSIERVWCAGQQQLPSRARASRLDRCNHRVPAGGLGGIKKPGTGPRVAGGRTKKTRGIGGTGAGAGEISRTDHLT